MREIKFKAKTATTNRWAYGHYAFTQGHHVVYEDGVPFVIVLNTLGQYTGLKDKNGVDIYEGDVLTLKYPRDRRYMVTAKVIGGTQISAMVLKFEDGFTTEEIPLYKISAEHNLEVIGNIYENPELLERETE